MATCDICINLSDIMTPQSFSSLITTLIKYLVYEKQLIPYPYDRLKFFIQKYNELNIEESNKRNKKNQYRLESGKYFKKVADAINTLETVFQCVEKEFLSCVHNHIESVIILIGSNVLNPLTVFNIHVPELNYSHFEKQHSSRQHINNVFRNILNNDKFNDILTSNIIVETNLYVMFKVKKGEKMATDWCVPKEQFRILRGKQVILRFDQLQEEINAKKYETCCIKDRLGFEVFIDLDEKPLIQIPDIKYANNVVDWYLGKHHVTGFKNFQYNGIPISDTLLNPNCIKRFIS